MKKVTKRLLCIVLSLIFMVTPMLGFDAFADYKEITEETPLLDSNGTLTESGWCFQNKYQYDRSAIKASPFKIKEWDFYQISNEHYCMQITIADISIGGAVTVGFFDLDTGKEFSTLILDLLTFGSYHLSAGATAEHHYRFKRGSYDFTLDVGETQRVLHFTQKNVLKDFTVDMTLDKLPEQDYLTMAVPFEKANQFYFNQKLNCMAATGTIKYSDLQGNDYDIEFKGKEDSSYCVLDWGRGVWPFHEDWWWGNGSTTMDDGSVFGFEIGWGFGNTDDGIENAVFYNGKGTKVGKITLQNEDEIMNDWTGQDWVFKSDDGKFEMTMTPTFDHYTHLRFFGIGNICHQVFGKWNGTVTLDDGTVLQIHNMTAFTEHSDNRW